MNNTYQPLLAHTGKVLLAVGLIDIGIMIYCITQGISYSSSFNLFAVIAGAFLLRGSLRAASIIRALSIFLLGCLTAMTIGWPFMQPLDLTLTQARLAPASTALSLALLVFSGGLLVWVATSLSQETIQDAQRAAGRKVRGARVPALAGLGMTVVLGVLAASLLRGESANKAVAAARLKLGPQYKYHVTSIHIATTDGVTSVSGVVTAWNATQLRQVPVSWQER